MEEYFNSERKVWQSVLHMALFLAAHTLQLKYFFQGMKWKEVTLHHLTIVAS